MAVSCLITALSVYAQNDSLNKPQIYYYSNGEIASRGTINEGKPNGTWETYYPKGKIKSKGDWSNGKLNGKWEFFDSNGKKQKELCYLNGEKHGLCIDYQQIYKNGMYNELPLRKELYESGQRIGKGFYYSEKGCLERVIPFAKGEQNGMGIILNCEGKSKKIIHFQNGLMVDEEEVNGLDTLGNLNGKWIWLYENYELKEEINFRNGVKHGWQRSYLQNGDLISSILYQEGEIHSSKNISGIDYMEYTDSTGNIFKGTFANNVPIGLHIEIDTITSNCQDFSLKGFLVGKGKCSTTGIKENEWLLFSENGELSAKGNYRNGKRQGKWIFYTAKGVEEQTGVYVNGMEHGKWVWNYPSGKLRKEENYIYGLKEGVYTEYDSTGAILVNGNYTEGLEDGEWQVNIGEILWKGFYNFGELNGKAISNFLNGEVYFEGRFENGYQDGKHRYYFENGQLKEEQYWEMGERVGTWLKFNENGEQLISITYKNGSEYLINGVRVKY